jgi:signal transduction histidine kinase
MRERTAELGGTCLVTGEPGAGTTVEVTLPVPAAGAAPEQQPVALSPTHQAG